MLAIKHKFVYDEKVVRFVFSLLTASLFFAIGFIFSSTALATCSLSITPQKVPGDYNGKITIQSNIDCFDVNTTYTINAHPMRADSNSGLYANYPTERTKPINEKTMETELNLFQGSIGRQNPGAWKVLVCTGNLSDCNQTSLGDVLIAVEAPIPTPTPIPPLPPCATLTPDGKCIAVNTAIGQISTEPQSFVKSIFTIVLGLAGGIALILIMVSGYRFMASQGNPEQVTAARDHLISAIVGLLFIIFSFVILQVIGVDILRIPGFTK